MASKYYPYFKGHRQMEELDYKTHSYSECEIVGTECEECEKYYWEEVHADFCDESCTARWEEDDAETGVFDSGQCHGCTCEHCEAEDNVYII